MLITQIDMAEANAENELERHCRVVRAKRKTVINTVIVGLLATAAIASQAFAAAPMTRPDLDNRPQKPIRRDQTSEPCNRPIPKGTLFLVIRMPDGRTVLIDASTIARKC